MSQDDESERIESAAMSGCLAVAAVGFFMLMILAIIAALIWKETV